MDGLTVELCTAFTLTFKLFTFNFRRLLNPLKPYQRFVAGQLDQGDALGVTTQARYFINPRADEILGHKVYASLADLPVVPDIVDVFRKDDDLPGVAREAVEVGAKVLWLQLGSWNEEAAAIAEAGGLDVVMDRCVKIEHARFHGGLHLAGFDTGVISSKRQVVAR